ncbi:MAG: class I SAM-dependent methyltransferase [Bdellovibrionales bacterium]|jgi:ubiquinone/menaquinone biosynthesis C-methylase UbiE|nr:class I SAM-dependent methyltransferase [Bdellovibrionales bacterium]MBT3524848.1 class I SAM-dependent methyltransferase [Bdellovibrionales bacterium]MBT7668978.1 class I SAM-dependent methyltransferase [Bdellovibrionales bacterium]MBT7767211.1 class I SAM-dependent methyltransferase [Bdellovibrionales bacterium]
MEKSGSELSLEQKYQLYEGSVQCHESDLDFLNQEYEREFGRIPLVLREDFCGTGMLACGWADQSGEHHAYGIDLDYEPISYGKQHHLTKLSEEARERVHFVEADVLNDCSFKSDIVVAFNFSYFIFKQRAKLLEYFSQVRKGLSPQGAFFIDIFGGTDSYAPVEEETEYDDYSYFWDCESYNPLTSECLYHIHFKYEDGTKYKNVFTYDWRMWSVREVVEVMNEAGFSKVHTYWEGVDEEDGSGDGNFYRSSDEENCESWVTYIVGIN